MIDTDLLMNVGIPLVAIVGGLIIAGFTIYSKTRKAEIEAYSGQSIEGFAREIMEQNISLKLELIEIKENLASINKLLKEIE
ncbi:MAG: hypothetical protein FWD82_05660 [Defluviitaleaceae bacterium]|nr:hypothetical protein [Defluviitaleaceae bacterium]